MGSLHNPTMSLKSSECFKLHLQLQCNQFYFSGGRSSLVIQHDPKSNDVKKKQETLFPYLASGFQDCLLEHIGISFYRGDSNHKW
ncbi:hypothetical protein DN41_3525 [Vibrio cholerae]|nr:hypothetical protein DN41_3525 [Vibrio cholerae]